jgi:beta-phosphoglucomutase-like phosphatase (HAD superfamily)
VAEKKQPTAKKRETSEPMAILFELENVAVKGHGIAYETLRDVLGKKSATLTPALFCRHCLYRAPKDYVAAVLKATGKERLSADKLAEEIGAAFVAAFSDPKLKLATDLKKLLKSAAERNFVVGALSCLDKTVAQTLAANVGLTDMGVTTLQALNNDAWHPGVEAWLKLAKTAGAHPFRCVAIVSSALSCRAALSARMKCIAQPNSLTAFEDFGGADYLVDSLDEIAIDRIAQLLEFAW